MVWGVQSMVAMMVPACTEMPDEAPDIASLHGLRTVEAPPEVTDALGRTWTLRGDVAGLRAAGSATGARVGRPEEDDAHDEGLALVTTGGAVYEAGPVDEEQLAAFVEGYYRRFGVAGDAEPVAETPARDPLARVVGLTDDRGDLDEQARPYTNIRKLIFSVRGRDGTPLAGAAECSGVALTPWLVLTAAHCLEARGGVAEDPETPPFPDDIRVCRDADARTDRYDADCANAGLFLVNVDWSNLSFRADWALVHTDWMVSDFTPDFALAPSDFESRPGQVVNGAGFPGGNVRYPAGVSYPSGVRHFGCEVYQAHERRLSYTCDTVGGQSGQPVWVKESDGGRFVVAVHAGTTGLWNAGARMSFWSDEVLSAMGSVGVGQRSDNGSAWEAVLP